LDFVAVEYNYAKPVALVEYKLHTATVNYSHPTYRAQNHLASNHNPPLPYFIAFYWPDIWAYRVVPMNDQARSWFVKDRVYTEREYVKKLYQMRDQVIAAEVEKLSDT